MQQRQPSKSEIAAQKRVIKLAPAIGDWTTYTPKKVLVKKVKTGLYGFDRLSKDELNRVLLIHYRFIQDLLKRLKIDLGMSVELYSVQVEQTTYLNFLRTLMGPMVQCKINISGTHDSIFLFMDLSLANSIINYALGSVDLEPINRELTEAEKTALSTTLTEYLPGFSAAFENAIENLSLSIVSSPDVSMDPTIIPTSTFVSFSAETSLADSPPGKIFIAYCGNTLKGLLVKYLQKDLGKVLDFSRFPASLLSKIVSPITATLGETMITANEIRQFEIGDVVSLDTSIASPIPTTIGNILKLLCQPGIKNKKAAIRIVGLKEAAEIELPPPELATEKEKEEAIKEIPEPPPPEEKKPVKEKELPEEELPEKNLEEEEEFTEEELFPEEEAEEEEEFTEEELFPEEEEEL